MSSARDLITNSSRPRCLSIAMKMAGARYKIASRLKKQGKQGGGQAGERLFPRPIQVLQRSCGQSPRMVASNTSTICFFIPDRRRTPTRQAFKARLWVTDRFAMDSCITHSMYVGLPRIRPKDPGSFCFAALVVLSSDSPGGSPPYIQDKLLLCRRAQKHICGLTIDPKLLFQRSRCC